MNASGGEDTERSSSDAFLLMMNPNNNSCHVTIEETSAAAATADTSNCNSNSHTTIIRVLPPCVVDRIAAGEVVQRAAAAVKELLENSLDAGADAIQVVVGIGNIYCNISSSSSTTAASTKSSASATTTVLDTFSVSDNGSGISPADLPLACTRHATSKLSATANYDLQRISSLGFRGEALASISMVARVKIVSKTKTQTTQPSQTTTTAAAASAANGTAAAYLMHYLDGRPVPAVNQNATTASTTSTTTTTTTTASGGGEGVVVVVTPTPTARTAGTTVFVTDLFYNLPHRQRLRAADEYQAVLSVVQRYAVHCARAGVALHCCRRNTTTTSTMHKQQKKNGNSNNSNTNKTDLNTAPHVSALQRHQRLLQLERAQQQQQQQQLNDDTMATSATITTTAIEDNDAAAAANVLLLQTMQETATKQVIGHVFGSSSPLLPHSCELYDSAADDSTTMLLVVDGDDEKKEDAVATTTTNAAATASYCSAEASSSSSLQLIYSCTGFVTSPSYQQATGGSSSSKATTTMKKQRSTTTLILFVNHRLVDGCTALKRAVESVYAEYGNSSSAGSSSKKPPFFAYLALTVPPETVDVNVHPTKRDVTLLHLDRICQHLAQQLRLTLAATGQSFPVSASLSQQQQIVVAKVQKNHENPYSNKKRKEPPLSTETYPSVGGAAAAKLAKPPPKSMVRTSRSTQAGALEPFLVARRMSQSLSQSQNNSKDDDGDNDGIPAVLPQSNSALPLPSVGPKQTLPATQTSGDNDDASTTANSKHKPDCPLRVGSTTDSSNSKATIDLSLPGAFAIAAARCTCLINKMDLLVTNSSNESEQPVVRLARQVTATTTAAGKSQGLRLQRMAPTVCKYSSVKQLRKRVQKHRAVDLEKKLRAACFVGSVSHNRSLIQCGEELVMMNHHECARALFYQLALNRFGGGCGLAQLLGHDDDAVTSLTPATTCAAGIDIESAIGQFVQMEEILQQTAPAEVDLDSLLSLPLSVSETNQSLAEQAGACLLQHAEMLLEYYSISIKKDDQGKIRLTGLPVLLEGYEPSPHGLPLFLLRLATEVDWTEEKPCFYGICRELGSYYAQLPSATTDERRDHAATVRHTIFPAVSTLLFPTEQMKDRDFVTLTSLPKLYRVFERC